jgi:hypothetical protein
MAQKMAQKIEVPLFSFSRFSGMNTVEKDFRLPVTRDAHYNVLSDMLLIENLDIDNSMTLSTRPGSDLEISGTDVHSLWSDGNITAFYVDSPVLYKLNVGYSATSLGTVGTGRMSYAKWNDRIYLTNNVGIWYCKDSLTALSTDVTYKLPMPPGKFIAYYKARLYVAKGKVLYISDALCDHYDIRTGFRVFSNDITMLIAVDKGLYVSDGETWFVSGAEPDEFHRNKVLDVDAIPYTAALVNGEYVGDGVQGNHALWVSADGICLGNSDGAVKNLTRSRYAMTDYGIGGAAIRKVNETVHYIATLE